MKNILQYGLQRSGTNILETYLNQNFKIEILNNNLNRADSVHKHFRLYDNKSFIPDKMFINDLSFVSFSEFENSLKLNSAIDAIIVISKDPYSWYVSYLNWAEKCNWTKANYHYIEEFNSFYEKWVNFSKEDKRISLVRYIDLLEDPKKVLNQLKYKHGFSLKFIRKVFGINYNINKVAQSASFNDNMLKYYTQKEFLKKLSEIEIKEINKMLNVNLMVELGYSIELIDE